MRRRVLFVLGCTMIFLFTACERDAQLNEIQGFTMGTYYRVLYLGRPDSTLAREVDSLLKDWNRQVSVFDTASVVSRLNSGEDVELSDDFIRLFEEAQRISALTDGAFDPTVAPLVNLYGFGRDISVTITSAMRDSVMQFIGYQKVQLRDKHLIKQDKRIILDYNAIAKGMAVDLIAQWVKNKGYGNCLVDIGGEIVTCGDKKGEPWMVGIQVPTTQRDGAIAASYIFPLCDGAVATSGNYRNYHQKADSRTTHIVNPRTGLATPTDLLSVTVCAEACVTADALATAFMVLGVEKSLQLLRRNPQWAGYFIYQENGRQKSIATANFPKK